MTDQEDHFAILHPAGHVSYGQLGTGESAHAAIRRTIPGLSSKGMGRLRAWFTDNFGPDLAPNPLADVVLSAVGYRHPTGWYGPVGLTMEEGDEGEYEPLPPEVRATIDELAGQRTASTD